MKRVRFLDPAGSVRTGQWLDAEGNVADTETTGTGGKITASCRSYDPAAVTVLPPSNPSKIVCVGRNYAAHAEEMGGEVPDRPSLFLKPPNTLAHHGSDVTLPAGKARIDYEAELAVVIDKQCRNVARGDVESVIAGYTCLVDLSNRDDQSMEQNWVRGKAFDNAAPVGPALATPEHVPADAKIELAVDGQVKQSASREQLIFSVPDLIEEITTYMTLEPGDVIATGTPEGVGPLADGEEISLEIEGIGTLQHTVRIPEES